MIVKKDDVKSLIISMAGNAIYQIIVATLSSASITAIVSVIISFFAKQSFLSIFILFFIFEICMSVLLKIISKKIISANVKNKEVLKDNKTDDISIEVNSKKTGEDNYYFVNYTKHVTVYKNGNGIIMNDFNLVVNKPDLFKEFRRKINIEDGKRDSQFPSLSKMKETDKTARFSKFGFWVYKSADSIINSTIEKYWSDTDPDEIDYKAMDNEKELRWVFKINRGNIKPQTEHKIAYAISVPGLYPIEKGIFVESIANQPQDAGKALSSIHVEHLINKITYILSLEDGIKLEDEPECFINNSIRVPVHNVIVEEGIFYHKYIFTIDEPSYGTNVVVKWRFKGGSEMSADKEGGD